MKWPGFVRTLTGILKVDVICNIQINVVHRPTVAPSPITNKLVKLSTFGARFSIIFANLALKNNHSDYFFLVTVDQIAVMRGGVNAPILLGDFPERIKIPQVFFK